MVDFFKPLINLPRNEMATKNAKFYSMKFNRPETIKSHRSEASAITAARDYGMIFDTALNKQFQIHLMSNGTMKRFQEGKQGFEPMDFSMLSELEKAKLVSVNKMVDYDSFCLHLGIQAYDGGAELGSSLELYEHYENTYNTQIEMAKIRSLTAIPPRLESLLPFAVKTIGNFNSSECINVIEEELTPFECKLAREFLDWLNQSKLQFGHNIKSVFKDFLKLEYNL